MATEEVTIKINTVMGSTKGYDDAAAYAQKAMTGAAQQGGHQVGQQFMSGIAKSVVQSQGGGSGGGVGKKGGILGVLESVAGNAASGNAMGLLGMLGRFAGVGAALATVATVAQKIGVTATMANAGMSGMGGLRGQGVVGTVMGVKDFFTARSTRESMEDLQVSQNDHTRSLLQARSDLNTDVQMRRAGTQFAPLTQANPFERVREERELLKRQRADMEQRRHTAMRQFEDSATRLRQGRYIDIRTGHDISKEDALQQHAMLNQQNQKFQDRVEGFAGQSRDLEFGQLGMRKQVIESGRQAWGQMLPTDREFTRRALEKMRAGGQLSPSELSAAQAVPEAAEGVRKYIEGQANNGAGPGYNEMVAQVGDPEYRDAARKKIQFGGTIEHHLDQAQVAAAAQKLVTDITEAGNEVRQRINESLEQARQNANVRVVDRGLIQDRTQQGVR